jgi:CBS domain-containing protein
LLQGSQISEGKFIAISAQQLLSDKGYEMYSVSPDTSVYEAIKLMTEAKVGALLVMDDNKLTGIISERDYTRKVILETRSSHETSVRDIMTSEVLTVTSEQPIEDCMKVMSEYHIRHLPVLENDQPIGMLSVMDVVKNIISEKEFIIGQLENYISG